MSHCIVCNHKLGLHKDTGVFWRCADIGKDGAQCECCLRKDHAYFKLSYYSREDRINAEGIK